MSKPVPQEFYRRAEIPGIPYARYWGDEEPTELMASYFDYSEEDKQAKFGGVIGVPWHTLAVSGGGADGAFGGGFLTGWSEARTRPAFTSVTGISTGAMTAPFAFLGTDYDEVLEDIYTSYSTKDLVRAAPFSAVGGSSLFKTDGLERMVAQYISEEVFTEIGERARRFPGVI